MFDSPGESTPSRSRDPRLKRCAGEPDWSQVEVSSTEAQTRQFVTLYQALQGFDDRAAQAQIKCPRLCFVGSADEIDYGERWGGVHVSFAGRVISRRGELEALGWQVRVLEGLTLAVDLRSAARRCQSTEKPAGRPVRPVAASSSGPARPSATARSATRWSACAAAVAGTSGGTPSAVARSAV